MIDFDSKKFRDQLMGCWMGKNCGGTLGTPLEKAYGEEEPFNINWYPKLEPGGMPNDDLEMQLIWLKALEEVGPGLTARELAQYWLDHIGYNWDEYGLSKTNLRLGLLPPVSGAWNNWFVDCMGCPIRSEIWACVAPGAPRRAVRYAYEDAICDHAGGESIWGEFFNTAMESAAFVEGDVHRLLDIGRSYVPDGTKTARAIDAAREAHRKGQDWKAARKAVMKATPHYVAQYSPINMGFQVIGLLYGRGFGHTLCLTVNCGYDTDCTGATVGAILGILKGYSKLTKKWTEPLGEDIATNECWGGIKNVTDGENPIARNLSELTDRTMAMSRRVMAGVDVSREELMADEDIFKLARKKPMRVTFSSPEHPVHVDYGRDPVMVPREKKALTTVIDNPHPETRKIECRLYGPKGWKITPNKQFVELQPHRSRSLQWEVAAEAADIRNTNRLTFFVETEQRPSPPAVPVPLIGARALKVSGPHPMKTEKPRGPWKTIYGRGSQLPSESMPGPGVVFVKTFFKADKALSHALRVEAECPYRAWFDGKLIGEREGKGTVRPAQQGMNHAVRMKKGMHELLIRLEVPRGRKPEVHIVASEGDRLANGLIDAEWTRLP